MKTLNTIALLAAMSAALASGQSVVSFTLIDAGSHRPVPGYDPLVPGEILDLAKLPTGLNIRANISPGPVGSVRFALNDLANYRIESEAPYALEGDISGAYRPWHPAPGSYTLTATPFSGPNAGGIAGIPYTLPFSVQDSSIIAPPTDQAGLPAPGSAGVAISGERKLWHKVTLTFTGPGTNETATPNPFHDYRLDVTFVHAGSGERRVVPGYYAADGNAGETGAAAGNKWRVHFMPTHTGVWSYQASFRTGPGIASDVNPLAGAPSSFDRANGSLTIGANDKAGPDLRSKGLLRYVGKRYLQFAGNSEYFLQAGPGSPENFLAYSDFDGTYDLSGNFLHKYFPHVPDWRSGDPAWRSSSKGKGIIGAINYLSAKGMNSLYFLTYTIDKGDGMDVWPWSSPTVRNRFDVSKLDQWETVFAHMERRGIALFLLTQETENNHALDGGHLGATRMLYYRELVARFGHHLALTWILGEENTNTDAQRKSFARYIRSIDPYGHPIGVHTYPSHKDLVFSPLLGFGDFENASLQMARVGDTHNETIRWMDRSRAAGRQWVVTLDEIGPAGSGVLPDSRDPHHDEVRAMGLWGNLTAGGAGVHWYFGYDYPHNDLTLEDFRSRDAMYTQTRHAIDFFRNHLPFANMAHHDALTSSLSDYVLAQPGQIYAVYLPSGGTTNLNLAGHSGTFSVRWFNPLTGGSLQQGSIAAITGGGSRTIGQAPFGGDAVALIKRTGTDTGGGSPGEGSSGGTAFQPIRIDSGGTSYTDPQGNLWSPDTAYSGGNIYATSKSIANTTTPKLYQTERYNKGPLSYTFSVPNGTYTVTLKFAEIFFTSVKSRVFHIVLNGKTVESSFDIVAQAGGPNRAVDRTFTVGVTNGQLTIQLMPLVQNPKVSAIEIR